jgi:hypothetical protein
MKMVNSKKMSPEVLIYLQSIKQYFNSHVDAQKYFVIEGNEEMFFNDVCEMSQKNFDESGEPELSLLQFEMLKDKISKSLGKNIGAFVLLGQLGRISLN